MNLGKRRPLDDYDVSVGLSTVANTLLWRNLIMRQAVHLLG